MSKSAEIAEQLMRLAKALEASEYPTHEYVAMLFADEPTGNLDHATGLEIMRVLDDLAAQGRSIILVTHERAIAEHAGRILWLQDGAIAKDERR